MGTIWQRKYYISNNKTLPEHMAVNQIIYYLPARFPSSTLLLVLFCDCVYVKSRAIMKEMEQYNIILSPGIK